MGVPGGGPDQPRAADPSGGPLCGAPGRPSPGHHARLHAGPPQEAQADRALPAHSVQVGRFGALRTLFRSKSSLHPFFARLFGLVSCQQAMALRFFDSMCALLYFPRIPLPVHPVSSPTLFPTVR